MQRHSQLERIFSRGSLSLIELVAHFSLKTFLLESLVRYPHCVPSIDPSIPYIGLFDLRLLLIYDSRASFL